MEHVPYLGDGGGSGDSIARVEWFASHPGAGWRPCDGRTINAAVFTEMVEAGWTNANGVILPNINSSVNANGLTAYMYVSGPNETPVWTSNATLPEATNFGTISYQFVATDPDGSTITYTLANGAIANGLSLYSNGLMIGNAIQSESTTYNFTVRATDADGLYTDRSFTQSISSKAVLRYINNAVAVPEARANSTIYGYLIVTSANSTPVFYIDRGMSSGKWYWEHKFNANYILPGVTNNLAERAYGGYNGSDVTSIYSSGWPVNNFGTSAGTLSTQPNFGDIIGFCLDADAKTIQYRVNNTLAGSATFPGGKNGPFYAYFAYQSSPTNQEIRMGSTGCIYAPPAGYQYL